MGREALEVFVDDALRPGGIVAGDRRGHHVVGLAQIVELVVELAS